MTTVAFFNNKGGIGKTSLVYHLAWMYANLGVTVVVADLDPQANLTSMFLDEWSRDDLWSPPPPRETIHGALMPLLEGTGDISAPVTLSPRPTLCLVPGDLSLSVAEDDFSSQWPLCLDDNVRAFQVVSSLGRILKHAYDEAEAELVLIDVGPNLGAINRAALIAADYVVIPLAPDLLSLQGLRNLGPALAQWKHGWQQRLAQAEAMSELSDLQLPAGGMAPLGYVVQQHTLRVDRPLRKYARCIDAIPAEYHTAVLQHSVNASTVVGDVVGDDEYCLGLLKKYWSLTPLAREARKPMFHLRAADGTMGGHMKAIRDCYNEYRDLACKIANRVGVRCPQLD